MCALCAGVSGDAGQRRGAVKAGDEWLGETGKVVTTDDMGTEPVRNDEAIVSGHDDGVTGEDRARVVVDGHGLCNAAAGSAVVSRVEARLSSNRCGMLCNVLGHGAMPSCHSFGQAPPHTGSM